MSYQFHREAEVEHLETIAYYESQQPGLGASYLEDFDETMNKICEMPHRYRIERKPDIRRASLQKYPFTVLYREKVGIVQVLAVAHKRRRPGYWLKRL